MHPLISLETLKLRRMNLLQDSSCNRVSPKLQISPDFVDAIGLGAAEELVAIRYEKHICHKSRHGYNHFSFFLFLNYFLHRNAANQAAIFGAAKRAEMADIEQLKKIIPLITREIPFSQDVYELVFGVNVTDLDFGVQIDSVKQPIQSNSVGLMKHVTL